jgi:hypothetical protein
MERSFYGGTPARATATPGASGPPNAMTGSVPGAA